MIKLGLLIAAIGATGFIVWLSSASFDRFVAGRIKRELARLNIRAEIEQVEAQPFALAIEIRHLRLFAGAERQPTPAFFEASRLTADVNMTDLFRRRFELHRLELERPTVRVLFDETGHSNIESVDVSSLRSGPGRQPGAAPLLTIGHITVTEGTVEYQHQQHHLSGEAHNLELTVSPEAGATRIAFSATDGRLHLKKRTISDASMTLNALVNQERAHLQRLRVTTPFVDADLSGTLRHWSQPEYDLALVATLDLAHLTRDLKPGLSLTGTAKLAGRVTGKEKRFRLTGKVTSPELRMSGVRLTGFQFQAQGGTSISGKQSAGSPPAWLRGLLQSSRIRPGLIELTDFRGSVFMTPEQIDVKPFSASTLRGRVAGDARVRFTGASTIAAVFQSVDLHRAVAQVAGREFPVAGTVSGEVRFRWPATDFGRLAGRARVNIEPLASETNEYLPCSGTAAVAIDGRGLNLMESQLTIGTAEASVTGWITWKKRLDLRIDAMFNDLAEEDRFLEALSIDLAALTRGAVASLSGRGRFSGRIEGPVDRVSLSGRGAIHNLDLKPGRLISGRAAIEVRHRTVTLTQVRARFADGSQAAIALFRDELDVENGLAMEGRVSKVDLNRWWQRLNFSLPITGLATGDFNLSRLPKAPRGRVSFSLTSGQLQARQFNLAFDHLSGRFIADETGYNLRQVKLEVGPNVLTLSGKYQPATQEYTLLARGLNLDISRFDEGLEKRGLPLTGRLDIQLTGRGKLARPQFDGRFHLARLTVAGERAGTISGEVSAEGGDIHWHITSKLFDQRQEMTGRLELNDPARPLTLRATLRRFRADPVLRLITGLPAGVEVSLSGQVDASWSLVYPERRRTTVTLTQVQVSSGEFLLSNEQPLMVNLDGYQLDIEEVHFRGNQTDLKVAGVIDLTPVVEGEHPLKQARLNLGVDGTVNLQMASALYAGLFTGGRARLRVTVRGSLKDPRVSGIADIEQATARLIHFPVALRGGSGRVRFTRDRVLLERFTGRANQGDVTVEGGLLAKDFNPQRWRFNIHADGVVVRYPKGLRSVLVGELTLQGNQQVQVLSGFMNVRRAEYDRDIDLTELLLGRKTLSSSRPRLSGEPISPLTLDIRVQAVDSIFIHNNLANAQASAWLHVGGRLDRPVISGRVAATRGTLEFRNQDYEITVASVDLPDRPGEDMRFNLQAQTNISGYQVSIGVSGTPSNFKPTLRSEPPLSPEGVLSLIATGRANTISQETQALAQSSLGLATGLVSEVLSQQLERQIARQRFFGINRFQIEPLLQGQGSDPTARITVGQQVTKELSLTYSFSVASSEEPVVILEYKLSDRFSFVGARDENGKFSVDLRIRKRF